MKRSTFRRFSIWKALGPRPLRSNSVWCAPGPAKSPLSTDTPHYHVEGLGDGAEPSPDLPRSGFSVPTRFADYVDLASLHVRFVPSFKAVALVIRVDGIFSESSERDKGTMPFNEPLYVRVLDMVSSALSREGSELTGNIYTQLLYANLPLRADGSDAVQYYYVFSPLVR